MIREQQMQDMMTAAFWQDIEEGNQPDNGDAIEIAKTYERAYQHGWQDADQHPHWIPVEERLPEVGEKVIFYSPDLDDWLSGALQQDGTWWNEEYGTHFYGVTHWMEIVPPRKEDKE